ncbi:helix-turn-helix domain-containing protein [Paraburkholderia fungorum]|uniref:helix-turn-helix domain-containing protein n=1 Tax=Paraburkholderia fungorum TaxID=134537 RepID=UPI00402B0D8B
MKCIVELSEAEEKTLHQMSLNHQHRDMRIRAAGVMLLGRKIKLTEVAAQLSVSGQSAYNWAHAWRKSSICGLLVGHKGGRPSSLSEAMIATVIEAASAELMTLRQIAQRIEEVHGVPFSCRLDTLSTALKRAGVWRGLKRRYTPKAESICPRGFVSFQCNAHHGFSEPRPISSCPQHYETLRCPGFTIICQFRNHPIQAKSP